MRKYVIDDLVQGQVQFLGQEIDDFIIARKDGTATYFLASAIDDIDYKITHIIRGDDHLTNTPKTLAIYSAMNIELPLFAHIPLVHDIHGRKMSKRNSNVAFVDYYKDYLASSIFHYLTLLGNGMNHGVQDEFSIDYSKFDLSKVGLAAARFDINKLQYYNKYYILHHSNLFAQLCERKIINDHMLQNNSKEILSKIIDLVKSRCTVLSDFNKYITMYLSDTKYNGFDDVNLVVVNNIDLICEIVSNNISDTKMIFKALKELAQENSIHVKFIMEGLRIIIAGVNESPSILEMIQFIGVDVFGKRIEHWKGIVNKL
ncbi:MAG: glutamate--tRNA ligase family protein [Pseudomonadota bacterium]